MQLTQSLIIRPTDTYADYGTDPGQPTTGYLRFWASILGPTSTLLYRHLVDSTDDGRSYGYLDLDHLAHDLGLGRGRGEHSPIIRAWRRLQLFDLVFDVPDTPGHWQVPIHLPWLSDGQLARMRPDLARLERFYRDGIASVPRLHEPR